MRAAGYILLGEEAASQRRLNPQRGEIVARNYRPLNPLGLASLVQRQSALRVANKAFEDLIPGAIIGEVRIGEDRAEAASAVDAYDDQTLRLFDGQLPDHDLIRKTEDGSVGADAEGQAERRHCGKAP